MFQTFIIFQKKLMLTWWKRKKLLQIRNFHIINDFEQFFTMSTLIFLKNNKSFEHLNVLLCILFVPGVFQNFDVDFWSLLKAEKVLALKQFWRNFFFFNFIFFHPFESINFQRAGFLAFKEKIGPLLQPY